MRYALITLLLTFSAGCQHSSNCVTREELRDLLASPGIDNDFALAPDRVARLTRVADATFSATPPATYPAPEVMGVVDKYTGDLAAAIGAVDTCLRVCAANISNAETVAYKSTVAARSVDGTIDFRINMEQGSLENTGRPLDLGISGNGFFRVKWVNPSGDGFGYTRNGNFFANSEGVLVLGMGDGCKLEPEIKVPQGVTEVSISEGGSVEVLEPGQSSKTMVGQIQLTQFINPQGLKLQRGSVFVSTAAAGPAIQASPAQEGNGVVLQGFLESSNVDLAKEYLRLRFLQNWRSMMMRAIDAR